MSVHVQCIGVLWRQAIDNHVKFVMWPVVELTYLLFACRYGITQMFLQPFAMSKE